MNLQRSFWNDWNAATREQYVGDVSMDQARTVMAWLERLGRSDLRIIDVGCGAGWLCAGLARFGRVTGTDLSDEVLGRARRRWPEVAFVSGDFMELDFDWGSYDVAVSLEVLSHVADQPAFLRRISRLLAPAGLLMLGTQNRPALHRSRIPPPGPGQLRRWVDRHELAELLALDFQVRELFSITPQFNRGVLRLVNSRKLHALAGRVGLGPVSRAMRRLENGLWLGWTLMALAERRA